MTTFKPQPIVQAEASAVKEIVPVEQESRQQQGAGNCYTEPMLLSNCVTSELYLLT